MVVKTGKSGYIECRGGRKDERQVICTATDERKDIKQEKVLKVIENLNLFDDDLMTLVFDKNILATELLLNIILQRDDLKMILLEN